MVLRIIGAAAIACGLAAPAVADHEGWFSTEYCFDHACETHAEEHNHTKLISNLRDFTQGFCYTTERVAWYFETRGFEIINHRGSRRLTIEASRRLARAWNLEAEHGANTVRITFYVSDFLRAARRAGHCELG